MHTVPSPDQLGVALDEFVEPGIRFGTEFAEVEVEAEVNGTADPGGEGRGGQKEAR